MDIPVEAEVKYEISEERYKQLPQLLVSLGFKRAASVTHEDHYIHYERSSLGGFDFVRLRKQMREGGVIEYLWNKKAHAIDAAGNKIRLEEPRDINEAEFTQLALEAPDKHPVIIKNRQDFTGHIHDASATVSLDSILIGSEQKYFVEVEIITNQASGHAAREACRAWAQDALGVNGEEADSYLHQYLSSQLH